MHDLILSIVNSNMRDCDKVAAIAAISNGVQARKALYKARVQNGANKRIVIQLMAELNK